MCLGHQARALTLFFGSVDARGCSPRDSILEFHRALPNERRPLPRCSLQTRSQGQAMSKARSVAETAHLPPRSESLAAYDTLAQTRQSQVALVPSPERSPEKRSRVPRRQSRRAPKSPRPSHRAGQRCPQHAGPRPLADVDRRKSLQLASSERHRREAVHGASRAMPARAARFRSMGNVGCQTCW